MLLVWLSFLQLLQFLKSFMAFGSLVQLVQICVNELWTFVGFLLLFIFTFAQTFRVLGATFDEGQYEADYDPDHGDYQMMPMNLVYLIQTFRNSIGDVAPPHANYWINRYNEGD